MIQIAFIFFTHFSYLIELHCRTLVYLIYKPICFFFFQIMTTINKLIILPWVWCAYRTTPFPQFILTSFIFVMHGADKTPGGRAFQTRMVLGKNYDNDWMPMVVWSVCHTCFYTVFLVVLSRSIWYGHFIVFYFKEHCKSCFFSSLLQRCPFKVSGYHAYTGAGMVFVRYITCLPWTISILSISILRNWSSHTGHVYSTIGRTSVLVFLLRNPIVLFALL